MLARTAAAKTDRPFPTLVLELEARATWNGHVCGVDEAGRRSLLAKVERCGLVSVP